MSDEEIYGPGAVWRGQLEGCGEVIYRFLEPIPKAPPEVVEMRKELEFGASTWTRYARYQIKKLEMNETVVVSSDSAGRIVMQSPLKPELGILQFREMRKMKVHYLVGGDENWTPKEEPTITLSLLPRKTEEEEQEAMEREQVDQEEREAVRQQQKEKHAAEKAARDKEEAAKAMAANTLAAAKNSVKIPSPTTASAADAGNGGGSDIKGGSKRRDSMNSVTSNSRPDEPISEEEETYQTEVRDKMVYQAAAGHLDELRVLFTEHNHFLQDDSNVVASMGPLKNMTPLSAACEKGRAEVVRYLVDEKKADINRGCMAPVGENRIEKAEKRSPHGTLLGSPLNGQPFAAPQRRASEQNGFIPKILRPVHYAAKGRNVEIVRQLLECRANPEDAIGITCCHGDDRVLEELLKFQVTSNTLRESMITLSKNGHGSSLVKVLKMLPHTVNLTEALHSACYSARQSTIKILLAQHADPHAKFAERTALDIAEESDQIIVKELLETHKPTRRIVGRNVLTMKTMQG